MNTNTHFDHSTQDWQTFTNKRRQKLANHEKWQKNAHQKHASQSNRRWQNTCNYSSNKSNQQYYQGETKNGTKNYDKPITRQEKVQGKPVHENSAKLS